MKSNTVLKQEALDTIKGRWGSVVVVFLVYFLATMVFSLNLNLESIGSWGVVLSIVYFVIRICVTPTLVVGFKTFLLKFNRNQDAKLNVIFDDFKYFVKVRRNLNVVLLRSFYTFFWTLLLIIPGIIKSISYSQSIFISIDNPELSANESINKSMEMMKGHKMRYFILGLSFIGWILLGVLTLGIGFIWIAPYISVTTTKFYEDLKSQTVVPAAAPVSPAPAPIVSA